MMPGHATAAALSESLSPVRRIAVFRALFLGDLLCAVPALRALRRRFPVAEITLIGLPWAAELVARLPYLDRLALFPGYPGLAEVRHDADWTAAFIAAARAERYDLALQLHGDGHISNGFAAALGATTTIGYRRGLDARLTAGLEWVPDEHETCRWLRLVALLGAATDDTRLELPTTAADQEHARALLAAAPAADGPLIGLHVGAKDAARRWPPERFAALADALATRYRARIVLTGSAAERDLTGAVAAAMSARVLDLAGATDLGGFAATIEALDLLVTNDTGASHVAAAVGTASVVLFGPTRPARWAPLDRTRHRVVDAAALVGGDPETALRALPVAPVLERCGEALTPAAAAASPLPSRRERGR